MTDRVFRYQFKDSHGDAVEAIVAEPGSVYVRTYDGQYATFFDAPGTCLRRFLAKSDLSYMTHRFLSRAGNRQGTSQKLARAVRWDVALFWERLVGVLKEDLAQDAARAARENADAP